MKSIGYIIIFFVCMLYSCTDGGIIAKLGRIENVGTDNPTLALRMLDSLDIEVKGGDEYIRMRYELLSIYMNIKQHVFPNSAIKTNNLVAYFDKKGTSRDQQEASYCAGMTLANKGDQFSAIRYLQRSEKTAFNKDRRDSVLLRDTYSALYSLYSQVGDYPNAFMAAKEEMSVLKKIGDVTSVAATRLGEAYLSIDSVRQASECFDKALESIHLSKAQESQDVLYILLEKYSVLGMKAKADKCHFLLNANDSTALSPGRSNALGAYSRMKGNTNQAVSYYRTAYAQGKDENAAYNAAVALFNIYSKDGNMKAANDCARTIINMTSHSKSVKNMAIVGCQYGESDDSGKLHSVERWKDLYRNMFWTILFMATIIVMIVYIINMKHKNDALKKMLSYANDLKDAQQDIKNKDRQSQSLIQMLHKTELEKKAEEIVQSVKDAASGKRKLTEDEWRQLYKAVDDLHPHFRELLTEHIGNFSELQMQVCYLMRVGLSNPQIKNVTDVPRTTIWRWTNTYKWIYDKNIDE